MTDTPDLTNGATAGAGRDRAPRKSTGSRKAPARKVINPRDAANQAKADIPKTVGRPPASADIVRQITQLIAMFGVFAAMIDEYDGAVVIEHAAKVADSLATVAETSPGVKKGLETMVAGSAWSAVVMSILPIVVAILANHGVLPAGLRELGGVPIPDEPEPASATHPTGSPAPGLATVAQMFNPRADVA